MTSKHKQEQLKTATFKQGNKSFEIKKGEYLQRNSRPYTQYQTTFPKYSQSTSCQYMKDNKAKWIGRISLWEM